MTNFLTSSENHEADLADLKATVSSLSDEDLVAEHALAKTSAEDSAEDVSRYDWHPSPAYTGPDAPSKGDFELRSRRADEILEVYQKEMARRPHLTPEAVLAILKQRNEARRAELERLRAEQAALDEELLRLVDPS